jgi:hypothetical protein
MDEIDVVSRPGVGTTVRMRKTLKSPTMAEH